MWISLEVWMKQMTMMKQLLMMKIPKITEIIDSNEEIVSAAAKLDL